MSVFHRLSARPFGRGAAIVSIALVATATLSSAPVGAAGSGTCTSAPMLDLANPSAGDLLSPGDYIVSGVARDPASTIGDGIDRVELFVGNRELGGTEVGAAVPQQGVFAVTAKLPSNVIGGTSFFAYAHSSVTGQETAFRYRCSSVLRRHPRHVAALTWWRRRWSQPFRKLAACPQLRAPPVVRPRLRRRLD